MLSAELDAKIDGVLDALAAANLHQVRENLLRNNRGARTNLCNGAIINIFSTGTVQVQGSHIAETRWILREFVNDPPTVPPSGRSDCGCEHQSVSESPIRIVEDRAESDGPHNSPF